LLGSAIFFDFIGEKHIPLVTGNLCLKNSNFSWIVPREIDATCLVNIGGTLERDWDVNDRTEEQHVQIILKAFREDSILGR